MHPCQGNIERLFERPTDRKQRMDILELVDRGARTVSHLNRASQLRDVAEAFLKVIIKFDGYGIIAASPQAERVLGAAMILKPDLRGDGHGKTVILDLNIASGTLLARAARRLRESGNVEILVGVVICDLFQLEIDWIVPELSQVVVVGSISEPVLS